MSIKRSQIKNKKPPTKDFLQPQIIDYLSTFFATQTIVIRVYKEDDWLASTSPLQLLLWILFYAVYCIYCSGCSKFLVQSVDTECSLNIVFFRRYWNIFRTLFSLDVSVCTHTRQVENQRCSRTGRVQKNQNILKKKHDI